MEENNEKLIKNTDLVFKFENQLDSSVDSNLSFFGWEKSIEHFFYNYISGYKFAVLATFNEFQRSSHEHDIEIQDTISYPLVFLYRHIAELYLKYIYVLLYHPNQVELKNLIRKGHDLCKLWDNIKEKINNLSERVDFDVDMMAIEHYIQEINSHDPLSFSYRYPIKKDANIVHDKHKYLDIVNLNDRMLSFYKYLDLVISKTDDQWTDDELDEDFNKQFDETLNNSKDLIVCLLNYLQKKAEIKKSKQKQEKAFLTLSEIEDIDEDEEKKDILFMSNITENQKTLLILLYLAGSALPHQNLAHEKVERKKDIYKILLNSSNSDWGFNTNKSVYKDNIFKTYIFGSVKTVEYIHKILKELE